MSVDGAGDSCNTGNSGNSAAGSPPADTHLKEVPLHSDRVFDGTFLHVNRDTVRLPDGKQTLREYVVHPGAVMIIALFDDGRVVLERQYRYPLHRAFIEFPAGKIDTDEPPLSTAKRELQEETGYTAKVWNHLCTIHNAIAYSDEHIELYLATGLSSGEQRLDAGEFLDVFTMPAEELPDLVRRGEITDVKTIIGSMWLEKIRSEVWQVDGE